MRWYINKNIDSDEEIRERKDFYSELTKRDLIFENATKDFYVFKDRRKDNRCLIIGHTDDAFNIIEILKKKNAKRKYKFYLCVCAMSKAYLLQLYKMAVGDDLYISKQENVTISGVAYWGCKFLEKMSTGFGFKITQTEMYMYNLKAGFSDKLEQSFQKIKG